jgi:hypothetical protein
MNRKQFIILLVLVVVVGAAGILVYQKQNQDRKAGGAAIGRKLLADFPVNDVARITIRHDTNQVSLAKAEDVWRVAERNDYAANFNDLSDFLMKVRELKVVQAEQVGPSQLPRLSLAAGQGTNSPVVVEFKDKTGKSLQTLLLGKKHMRKSNRPSPMGDFGDDAGWPDGRYVKTESSPEVVLISEPLANIEPKPENWVSKDWFKVEKVKTIAVEFPEATNSWKLARETESGEWKLADAQPGEHPLDAGKVGGLATALSSPSFSDVKTPDQVNLESAKTITLETFDGFNYQIKVGEKADDQLPVRVNVSASLVSERTPGEDEKPEDKDRLDKEFKERHTKLQEKLAAEKAYGNWVYLASSWTLDSLLKNRSELLQEKKEETMTADDQEPTHALGPSGSPEAATGPAIVPVLPNQ